MHTDEATSPETPIPEAAPTRPRRRRPGSSSIVVLGPLSLMLAALIAVTGVGFMVTPDAERGWLHEQGVAVSDRAGLLAVAGIGAGLWLFSGWVLRDRVRILLRLRGSLLAFDRGERDAGALSLPGRSATGRAWNHLIRWREDGIDESIFDTVASASASGASDSGEHYCDALWQGVIVVDDQLIIRYANGAAAILVRSKRDALINADARKVFTDADVLKAIREAAESGSRQRQVVDVGDPSVPESSILRFSVRASGRDANLRVMIVVEDVTQQRVAEEVQHEFVAQAAHELRAPLTNMRLYIEQLIDEDLDAESRGTALNVLNQETGRLDRIVGDMLSISEIQSGQLNVQVGDVRLSPILDALEADYAALAKEKQITIRFELPPKYPSLSGDREKIDLVLHNLMGNAVKYTPVGGSVRLVVREQSQRLDFEFIDTGFGIAEDDQERIFDRFVRGKDSRVSELPGTGLGLALARDIARFHGGDIELHSELDVGSTFTFWLPIAVSSSAAAA